MLQAQNVDCGMQKLRLAESCIVATILSLAAAACTKNVTGSGINEPPEVSIVSPAVARTFAGGDSLFIEIRATDREQAIPANDVSWWIDLHHGTHTHPFAPRTVGTRGLVTVPRTGHPETEIFLRLYAAARDAGGLTDTVSIDVSPRLTTISIATLPAGLAVTVDGQPRATPVVLQTVSGMERVIVATSPQLLGDSIYAFRSWADGGAATRTVASATASDLVATYTATGRANVSPNVAITAPVAGRIVTAGIGVTISADASDSDGNVAKVRFLVGTTVIDEDLTVPYAVQWTPTTLGAQSLFAQAVDNDGATTLSAAVAVTVQAAGVGDVEAPLVALTSPAAGASGLTGTVELTATATDNVGVTSVEFEVDGQLLASDAVAPYTATIASTAAFVTGAHVVRARGGDAAGNWSPWSSAVVSFGGNTAFLPGYSKSIVASGFGSLLTAIAFAADGRIFVTELNGAVRVVKNGALLAQPFAAVTALVEGERGLVGIALDPAFETNGFVYIYYTTAIGGAHNRISRFTANGDLAVAGSEVVLVDLPVLSDARRHNGGAMNFGLDGALYVAVGDDGNGLNAPVLSTPFGKMLRFNPDGSIPADNPYFTQTTGINRAIWAKGLRNPYTFAIHPGTGRMHINDVGQETWEEVNLGRRGADYGWPSTEGATSNPSFDSPILAVRHSNSPTLFDANAIVGGAFYNPLVAMFGTVYVGDYFFADYVLGWVYRMDMDNGNAVNAFAQTGAMVTGLGVGRDGAIYVLIGTKLERIAR